LRCRRRQLPCSNLASRLGHTMPRNSAICRETRRQPLALSNSSVPCGTCVCARMRPPCRSRRDSSPGLSPLLSGVAHGLVASGGDLKHGIMTRESCPKWVHIHRFAAQKPHRCAFLWKAETRRTRRGHAYGIQLGLFQFAGRVTSPSHKEREHAQPCVRFRQLRSKVSARARCPS